MSLSKSKRAIATGLSRSARPKSLDSAVLDSLAAYVDRHSIAPGSRLPSERVLCEALEVGRSTVREALKRWEALGIVEISHGSGVYLKVAVSPKLLHVPLILTRPSKVKNLLQILEVRRALEGEAAAVCAVSAAEDDISAIGMALDAMESAYRAGKGPEADWQFHELVYQSTGNPFFPQIIQSMRSLLHQLWENPLELPDFAAASFPYHRTMYDAIACRDPHAARAEAWKLIDSVSNEIREAFPDEA